MQGAWERRGKAGKGKRIILHANFCGGTSAQPGRCVFSQAKELWHTLSPVRRARAITHYLEKSSPPERFQVLALSQSKRANHALTRHPPRAGAQAEPAGAAHGRAAAADAFREREESQVEAERVWLAAVLLAVAACAPRLAWRGAAHRRPHGVAARPAHRTTTACPHQLLSQRTAPCPPTAASLCACRPAATAARALEQLAVYSHLPPVRHHLPRKTQFFERANGTDGGERPRARGKGGWDSQGRARAHCRVHAPQVTSAPCWCDHPPLSARRSAAVSAWCPAASTRRPPPRVARACGLARSSRRLHASRRRRRRGIRCRQ